MPITVTTEDVIDDMMGIYVSGGPHTVYGQSIPDVAVSAQIDYALTLINNIAGTDRINTEFLASTDVYVQDLPRQAVIKVAAHRLINRMLGNIMTEDYSVSVDGLNIQKGNFPQIIVSQLEHYYQESRELIQMLKPGAVVIDQHRTSIPQNGMYISRDSPGYYGSGAFNAFSGNDGF